MGFFGWLFTAVLVAGFCAGMVIGYSFLKVRGSAHCNDFSAFRCHSRKRRLIDQHYLEALEHFQLMPLARQVCKRTLGSHSTYSHHVHRLRYLGLVADSEVNDLLSFVRDSLNL
jgi:hypothetical protein